MPLLWWFGGFYIFFKILSNTAWARANCSRPSAQSWSPDVRGVGRTGIGDMLWREGTVCAIVQRDAESARVRVLNMLLCDFTVTGNCLGARVQWQRNV